MNESWYALRSKPRKEEIVYRQAVALGVEVYYPRLRVKPVNPRSRPYKPYFPGYLFVKADLEVVGLSTFQWMPHTLGLVCFGGEPASVPAALIQAIRQRVEALNLGKVSQDDLRSGDWVWIRSGPFRGYEAIFDARLPGSERVRVLLQFLGDQRQVPLILHADQVEKGRPRAG